MVMEERWDVQGPTTIEVGGPGDRVREVQVHLVGGRADVVGRAVPTVDTADEESDGAAYLEVSSLRGRGLEVTYVDGVLVVRHPQLRWSSLLDGVKGALTLEDAAVVSIEVPSDVAVRLGTVSADGLVSGVHRPVGVRTVSGTIAVDDVHADLEARTVSGSIEVSGQSGSVTADSVSGSLTVQADHLPRLAAGTVSGSLTVDVASAPTRLTAKSVSGDVTVRIPADAGFRLEARSVSGAVVADGERLPSKPGTVEGRLGSGGDVTVTARTVSGDITVLRAAGAPSVGLTLEKVGPQ